MTEAIQILKDYQKKVDVELIAFLNEKISEAKGQDSFSIELLKRIKEVSEKGGGKRIRPAMAIFGFKCFDSSTEKEIIKASISLELIHTFFLFHDDIMDESDTRRGLPTLHKQYESIALESFPSFNPRRFGESMAMLGGDLLSSFGFEAVLRTSFSEKQKLTALRKLNDIIFFTCFGQIKDVLNEGRKDFTEADVLNVHTLKTAKYSIEGPCQFGAMFANASQKDLKVFTDYGIPVGIAFQVQDDLLGVFGDEKKIGKSADSDLKEGKKTLLILKALENGSEKQKKVIYSVLGNRNASPEKINEVREIIKETKSFDYSVKKAKELLEKGKKEMKKSKFKSEGKEFLIGIADYMLSREY